MIPLLAAATPEVTPTSVGVFVLIAIQLSQFFFAYKKDSRDGQAVLKSDLDLLKKDLEKQIAGVGDELDDFSQSMETKMETSRKESSRSRDEIHKQISGVALSNAALVKGQENIEQTVIAQASKLDRLLSRYP